MLISAAVEFRIQETVVPAFVEEAAAPLMQLRVPCGTMLARPFCRTVLLAVTDLESEGHL